MLVQYLLDPAFGMEITIQLFLLVSLSVCVFGCSYVWSEIVFSAQYVYHRNWAIWYLIVLWVLDEIMSASEPIVSWIYCAFLASDYSITVCLLLYFLHY